MNATPLGVQTVMIGAMRDDPHRKHTCLVDYLYLYYSTTIE